MWVRQVPVAGLYLALPSNQLSGNPLAVKCLLHGCDVLAVRLRPFSLSCTRTVPANPCCCSSNATVLQPACNASLLGKPSALHAAGACENPTALQQLVQPSHIESIGLQPHEQKCLQWQHYWQRYSSRELSWSNWSKWPQQHAQWWQQQRCTAVNSKNPALPSPLASSFPVMQHHWQLLYHCYHSQPDRSRQSQQQSAVPELVQKPAAAPQTATQQQQQQQGTPGASFTSLPNLLSLSRVASGPWVAYLIATQQWPMAVGLTALAGATDWLDGHLARRMGHTSKLGSYLDPFADKILIGSVVGTMGYLGMVPTWLAVMVVGRDTAQVIGMFWYRVKMFGGRWPGAAAFFDVDRNVPNIPAAAASTVNSSSASKIAAGTAVSGGLPQMTPLMVSKVNTALVLALVAGCMTQQWQAVPGQDVLDLLEYAAAGTTAVSAVAYVRLYREGKLLPALGSRGQPVET